MFIASNTNIMKNRAEKKKFDQIFPEGNSFLIET